MKKRTIPSLEGLILGKWKVGEEIPPSENGKHIFYWCTCECGAISKVDYYHLKNGNSKGCRDCTKKRICKKGHDTWDCGRAEDFKCKACTVEGHVRRTYGISLEEYCALYAFQGGKCAICERPLLVNPALPIAPPTEGNPTRAEVDHRHVPKKVKPQPEKRTLVRGLLCGGRYAGCNAKLGHVDNIEWLKAAVAYLEELPAQKLLKIMDEHRQRQELIENK